MRFLISIPLLLLLVLFALSNQQDVRLGLWPTDLALVVPVSAAILVAMAIAFLVGALFTWFAALGARHRARRAEETVRLLEAELRDTKARATQRTATTPALEP